MRVLVTGGAGFIGSHVVDALLAEGHQVAVVDNFSTGKEENLSPDIPVYRLDIARDSLEEVFAKEKPECVNHHAAQIDVARSVAEPGHDAEVNILGTMRLLDCCRRYGVGRFVFAASGGTAYGEATTLPASEDAPAHPLSPYGVSKRAAEQYVEYFGETAGMDTLCLRYGNVYGPRQDPHGEAGVVAIFIQRILNGQRPLIHGTGEQLRDYIHVEDVVRANLCALSRGKREILNIGTGIGTSVNELFSLLKEILRYDGDAGHDPPRQGDIQRNYLDPSRARSVLGWTPQIPLREGLEKTAEWFFSRRKTAC